MIRPGGSCQQYYDKKNKTFVAPPETKSATIATHFVSKDGTLPQIL